MKKIFLISVSSILLLCSCNKEQTCVCTMKGPSITVAGYSFEGEDYTNNYTLHGSKSRAEKTCNSLNVSGSSSSVSGYGSSGTLITATCVLE